MSKGANINVANFIGKTIESMDISTVNCIKFFFTDGTSIELETEAVGYGIYGITDAYQENNAV